LQAEVKPSLVLQAEVVVFCQGCASSFRHSGTVRVGSDAPGIGCGWGDPMTLELLCDAYETLERAESSDELCTEMKKFAQQMGFEHFAYALTINAPSLKLQQHVINGYPRQWFERYVERNYFKVDPLVRHAEKSTLPAIWEDRAFHQSATAEFWDEARAIGLLAGVSFAVHEQPGVTGIFSLARDQSLDLRGVELAILIGRAQLFASLLHHAVARIELPKLLPAQTMSLTCRERECLKWTADGKTAWEIGQILNISERTTVFHINNAIRKLDASNKTQAIVRAVALRLL
jgi:DNA-binding CsgD family transcriptional regulator